VRLWTTKIFSLEIINFLNNKKNHPEVDISAVSSLPLGRYAKDKITDPRGWAFEILSLPLREKS
jgi:hypothetical protein